MSSNYQNNNTGNNNEVFTPTTRSSYKFYNSSSAVQNTVMSISYWNSLLKITMNEITVMEGSANKVDNDNHIDIYLSPSKAKLMLQSVQMFKANPDAYMNIGVNTNRGAIFIANGKKMFGKSNAGTCIVINLINNDTGQIESEAVYEFNCKDIYVITDFQGGSDFGKDSSSANSLELDMFENVLVQFIDAYTNAIASSVIECNKYNDNRQFSFIKDVREKLGISKYDGSKNYNRSSWFNNNGSSSSTVSDSSASRDTSSYEEVMADIEAMMD